MREDLLSPDCKATYGADNTAFAPRSDDTVNAYKDKFLPGQGGLLRIQRRFAGHWRASGKSRLLISSRIIYSEGTSKSVMQVANRTPNARLMAIGIRNRA